VDRAAILKGTARDQKETFDFEISPSGESSFALFISFHGNCCRNVTGAGVWPSLEKAKQIAEQTANELLHGAVITWIENKEGT